MQSKFPDLDFRSLNVEIQVIIAAQAKGRPGVFPTLTAQ